MGSDLCLPFTLATELVGILTNHSDKSHSVAAAEDKPTRKASEVGKSVAHRFGIDESLTATRKKLSGWVLCAQLLSAAVLAVVRMRANDKATTAAVRTGSQPARELFPLPPPPRPSSVLTDRAPSAPVIKTMAAALREVRLSMWTTGLISKA